MTFFWDIFIVIIFIKCYEDHIYLNIFILEIWSAEQKCLSHGVKRINIFVFFKDKDLKNLTLA